MQKKHLIITITTSLIAVIIIAVIAFLETSATVSPIINTPPSPIDADKITLTGTAEPNSKITVTGGAYQISPTYADETGYWEKTVSLIQESENVFYVFATGVDGQPSDSVTATIIESAEQAAEYEASSGISMTAPDSPTVDPVESPIDADSITLTGTATAGVEIMVSGDAIEYTTTNSSGEFSVEVDLEQNATSKFYISAISDSDLISEAVKIEIEEISEETSEPEEEETHDTAEGNTDETVSVNFPDITGHWAEDDIIELAEMGIVNGYDNGNFGPNDYITRAAITKIALNAFEYDVYEANSAFTDISDGVWYENYVNSAYEYGVINGYSDGTFKPGNYVNRAEAMKILLTASGIPDTAGAYIFIGNEDSWENPFSDVSTEDWFYEYVMQAYTGEIVSGYADGTFGGGNNITRAEVCKIVLNLLDLEDEIKATPTI